MLTPKQQHLLASLDPEALAILDLTPVTSQEFKTNQAINARVETWIHAASIQPFRARQVINPHHTRKPWEIVDPASIPEVQHTRKGWVCTHGKVIHCPF